MIAIVALVLVLAALGEWRHSRERARLLNAVMASVPHAAVAFRSLERREPKPGKEKPAEIYEQIGI